MKLGWVGLGWIVLGSVGLDWVGFGWVELGWPGLKLAEQVRPNRISQLILRPLRLLTDQMYSVFDVAQVNESGQVMGISPGTAVIAAKTIDGGYSATSQITVLKGTTAQGSAPFTDTNGHWANKEIAKAYELHIVNGYPDFTFRPDGSVTRAEFVVMLMNALKPEVQGAELTFQDKSEIAVWAEKAIRQTIQLGIVSGYPDGTFRPGVNITHAEMATIVSKTSGIPLDSNMRTGFTDDADIPDWARGAVSAAEKNGIIIVGGKTSGTFTPQALSTRAEAAAWLVNMLGIQAKG